MGYYTYILKSKTAEKYYICSCHDLNLRFESHNSGNSRSTKAHIPWEVAYYEIFDSKSYAIKRNNKRDNALVTTIDKEKTKTVDSIKLYFIPAALYTYAVVSYDGWNYFVIWLQFKSVIGFNLLWKWKNL
jgi:putative endonuclease